LSEYRKLRIYKLCRPLKKGSSRSSSWSESKV